MPSHEWYTKGFIHGAPGAVDCWDLRAECSKCGTKAILLGSVPESAVVAKEYDRHVVKALNPERARLLKQVPKVHEDCEQTIVDQVHGL